MTEPVPPSSLPEGLDLDLYSANCMNFAAHRSPVLTPPRSRMGEPYPDLTLYYECPSCATRWVGTFPAKTGE